MPLDRSRLLALALSRGLFVELARTQFCQQAAFFNEAPQAAQSHFKWLGFLLDEWWASVGSSPRIDFGACAVRKAGNSIRQLLRITTRLA